MFRVVWTQTAPDQTAAAWMRADSRSREAITRAAYEPDRSLSSDPQERGESRASGPRIALEPPLRIAHEIEAESSDVRAIYAVSFHRRDEA